MTIKEKAQEIANNGMNKDEVFRFFNNVKYCDVLEHITLFAMFGIDSNVTWDLFEEWEEDKMEDFE